MHTGCKVTSIPQSGSPDTPNIGVGCEECFALQLFLKASLFPPSLSLSFLRASGNHSNEKAHVKPYATHASLHWPCRLV
eukprot:2517907-Amphidinium_carterae.1